MVKHPLQVVTGQIKTKSQPLTRCLPLPIGSNYSLYCNDKLLVKIFCRLSAITDPIQELAKDKVPFNWGLEHQSAFTQRKQEIISTPI